MSSPATGSRRIVVIGGNGFVGSHVCQELLSRKSAGVGTDGEISVVSVSRSGLPPTNAGPWVRNVQWMKGDPSAPNAGEFLAALEGAVAVISTVGGFGDRARMVQKNGATNVAAIEAAKAKGVPRFVYISAHHFGLPDMLKKGYYEGKFMAEKALQSAYQDQGVILRPGLFIFGTRQVGSVGVPLWLIGRPLQWVTNNGVVQRGLLGLPFVGSVLAPLLLTPVSVHAVACSAVTAALAQPKPSKTVMEVPDILKHE